MVGSFLAKGHRFVKSPFIPFHFYCLILGVNSQSQVNGNAFGVSSLQTPVWIVNNIMAVNLCNKWFPLKMIPVANDAYEARTQ